MTAPQRTVTKSLPTTNKRPPPTPKFRSSSSSSSSSSSFCSSTTMGLRPPPYSPPDNTVVASLTESTTTTALLDFKGSNVFNGSNESLSRQGNRGAAEAPISPATAVAVVETTIIASGHEGQEETTTATTTPTSAPPQLTAEAAVEEEEKEESKRSERPIPCPSHPQRRSPQQKPWPRTRTRLARPPGNGRVVQFNCQVEIHWIPSCFQSTISEIRTLWYSAYDMDRFRAESRYLARETRMRGARVTAVIDQGYKQAQSCAEELVLLAEMKKKKKNCNSINEIDEEKEDVGEPEAEDDEENEEMALYQQILLPSYPPSSSSPSCCISATAAAPYHETTATLRKCCDETLEPLCLWAQRKFTCRGLEHFASKTHYLTRVEIKTALRKLVVKLSSSLPPSSLSWTDHQNLPEPSAKMADLPDQEHHHAHPEKDGGESYGRSHVPSSASSKKDDSDKDDDEDSTIGCNSLSELLSEESDSQFSDAMDQQNLQDQQQLTDQHERLALKIARESQRLSRKSRILARWFGLADAQFRIAHCKLDRLQQKILRDYYGDLHHQHQYHPRDYDEYSTDEEDPGVPDCPKSQQRRGQRRCGRCLSTQYHENHGSSLVAVVAYQGEENRNSMVDQEEHCHRDCNSDDPDCTTATRCSIPRLGNKIEEEEDGDGLLPQKPRPSAPREEDEAKEEAHVRGPLASQSPLWWSPVPSTQLQQQGTPGTPTVKDDAFGSTPQSLSSTESSAALSSSPSAILMMKMMEMPLPLSQTPSSPSYPLTPSAASTFEPTYALQTPNRRLMMPHMNSFPSSPLSFPSSSSSSPRGRQCNHRSTPLPRSAVSYVRPAGEA